MREGARRCRCRCLRVEIQGVWFWIRLERWQISMKIAIAIAAGSVQYSPKFEEMLIESEPASNHRNNNIGVLESPVVICRVRTKEQGGQPIKEPGQLSRRICSTKPTTTKSGKPQHHNETPKPTVRSPHNGHHDRDHTVVLFVVGE